MDYDMLLRLFNDEKGIALCMQELYRRHQFGGKRVFSQELHCYRLHAMGDKVKGVVCRS